MRVITFIIAFFLLLSVNAQQRIVGKSFVREGKVYLRWAPSSYEVMTGCSGAGYVIRQIKWNEDKFPDSSDFRNSSAVVQVAAAPKDDKRWEDLIQANGDAAFLYNVMFRQKQKSESQNEMFFGLAMLSCDFDVRLSEVAGLFLKDENPGTEKLAYIIQPADAKLRREIKPAIVVVNPSRNDFLKEIDSLFVKVRDKEVKLTWNAERLKSFYPGYFIEKSMDGKTFVQLNKKPHILIKTQYEKEKRIISFNDTATEYGKTYYYRVRGLGFFGVYGKYSSVVKAHLIQPLTSFASIDSTKLVRDSLFEVYWHKPIGVKDEEIAGYNVYRSKSDGGNYQRVNRRIIKGEYRLLDEHPYKTTFYKITTYNIYGDSITSFPYMSLIPDKTPPKVPAGFKGRIDSLGKVRLSWKPNKESDLMGYRLFRNNAPDEEPVEITKVIWRDTVYYDSVDVNTLTEEVYYFMTAVDQVYNNSNYSTPLKLKRPDKIKPVSVVFKELYHNDSIIILKWIPSTSKDVYGYELYRSDGGAFTKIKSWTPSDTVNAYYDRDLHYEKFYQYKIKVSDKSGNYSETISSAHYYDSRIRKPVTKVNFEVDREKKTITLKWDYSEKEIFNFVLYRGKKGEDLKAIRTLKGQSTSYVDKELYIGNVYVYKIKANFNSGAESLLSKEIEVVY